MEILKYILLCIVFLSSVLVGRNMAKKYYNRVLDLKEFKNSLNILKTKIRFTYEPIPEIFTQIVDTTNHPTRNIFKDTTKYIENLPTKDAWIKAVEKNKLNFTKEDIEIIKNLGKLLR